VNKSQNQSDIRIPSITQKGIDNTTAKHIPLSNLVTSSMLEASCILEYDFCVNEKFDPEVYTVETPCITPTLAVIPCDKIG